jgi:hypothetical protein
MRFITRKQEKRGLACYVCGKPLEREEALWELFCRNPDCEKYTPPKATP